MATGYPLNHWSIKVVIQPWVTCLLLGLNECYIQNHAKAQLWVSFLVFRASVLWIDPLAFPVRCSKCTLLYILTLPQSMMVYPVGFSFCNFLVFNFLVFVFSFFRFLVFIFFCFYFFVFVFFFYLKKKKNRKKKRQFEKQKQKKSKWKTKK